MEELKFTIRDLRTILFNVNNQNMTVSELRSKIFKIDDQDESLNTLQWKQICDLIK